MSPLGAQDDGERSGAALREGASNSLLLSLASGRLLGTAPVGRRDAADHDGGEYGVVAARALDLREQARKVERSVRGRVRRESA